MKDTIKDLLISTVISIAISMVIFCLFGIAFDIRTGGNFSLDNYQFTKMVIGSLLIGLGFGVPSIVYHKEMLSMPIKVTIHMGIGCAIYTIVVYAVGWINGAATIWQGIIIAVIQLAVAFIIWFLFMLYYRNEAKKMNHKIQEKNSEANSKISEKIS